MLLVIPVYQIVGGGEQGHSRRGAMGERMTSGFCPKLSQCVSRYEEGGVRSAYKTRILYVHLSIQLYKSECRCIHACYVVSPTSLSDGIK